MEPEESAPVRRLLQYSSDTAGGLMTPEPVVLSPDATIAEALARVRSPDLTPALASMVFVCRPPRPRRPAGTWAACTPSGCSASRRSSWSPGRWTRRWRGCRRKLRSADVTRFFASYNLVCAPVVDDEDHLLGAVTVDDVLDHLLPDNWREEGVEDG